MASDSTSGSTQALPSDVSASLTAIELLTEGLRECLTATAMPHFGWRLAVPEGGRHDAAFQAGYRLRVLDRTGACVWDSGYVASSMQHFVPYGGSPLEPDQDYSWTVCITDANGASGRWAAPARFSTGVYSWAAEWIRRQPGGRAPLERFDGVLRVGASPHLPLPCELPADAASPLDARTVTVLARLRLSVGPAGLLLRSTGPGTGLLLELDGSGRAVLRPAAVWELGDGSVPATEIIASGTVARGSSAHSGNWDANAWHDVAVTDDGATIAVAIDGRPVLSAVAPADSAAGGGLALHQGPRSHTEYALLRVTARVGGGEAATGAPEAVLLDADFSREDSLTDWNLRTPHRQPDEWTLAKTEIFLSGTVARARIFAAASHQARIYVNGRRRLDTVSFGYPGEHYYDATDVTPELQSAGDAITLAARAHWYGPGQGRAAGVPGLLVQLNVEYDDGRREVFGSGPGWMVAEGPYRQSGFRNDEGDPVEHFDATAYSAEWHPALSLGRHPVSAFPQVTPRRTFLAEHMLPAERILEAADGTPVADFGRVIPGRPVVEFHDGEHGRTVQLRAGYVLGPDGRVDLGMSASQNTDMSFPYTQKFGPQCFEAAVHLGFRYLELPGVRLADLGSVGAVIVHAKHPEEGSFSSSNATLDAVFGLLRDSALLGVQEQFVDTPTREKGQFLGDAANISYATMALFGERSYTAQALREFTCSALRYWDDPAERGRYNAVYPNGDGKRDIPDFSLMMPEWVAEYFRNSGDHGLLEELLPRLRATADYVLRHIPADGPTAGLVTHLGGGSGTYLHGIVDWPAPCRFGYDMECAARTTVNAQAWSVLDSLAWLCQVTGRERSASKYAATAAALADALNSRLRVDGVLVDGLRDDGRPSTNASQHATSFPLSFGITPVEVADDDAARLESLGMRQGPMTVHRLFRALLSQGRVDAVLDLLTNDTQPGWARQLLAGASFTWEAWDVQEGTDYSQSHAWSASVIREILGHVLGVRPEGFGVAGARPAVVIEPPVCSLDHAAGSVPLQQGLVETAWRRTDRGMELDCTVPAGVEGLVRLPAGDYEVQAPAGLPVPPSYRVMNNDAVAGRKAPAGSPTGFRIPPGTWSFRPASGL